MRSPSTSPRAVPFLALATPLIALASSCTPAHLGAGGDGGPGGECGDGFVGAGELCDDGNGESGDGCSADCQPEFPPNCGDGVLVPEEGEDCDDGNQEAGDGCGPGCWIEGCGNGFLDPGEACEDSNTVDGDGCSADCKSDESCTNGIVDTAAGEQCDDGNDDDTDACPASCEPARCGDGFVRKGIESCDDGNDTDGDGCTDCILDSCGNGDLDDGEECDDGAANGADGSSCFRTCLTTEVAVAQAFSEPVEPAAFGGFINPQWLDVADFNGDERLDVAVSAPDSALSAVIHGKGDGRLAPQRFVQATSGSSGSVLADVDGDGRADLIMASANTDSVVILLGSATGFVPNGSASTVIDTGGDGPFDVAAADLTGDGKIDLVTSNVISNDVTLLAGDGEGGFEATARFGVQSGNGGQRPEVVAIGDVTGDGGLDIVTANFTSSDVAVLAGLGAGAFAAPEITSTVAGAAGTGPRDLALADVTNDGKLDVLTADATSSDVAVLAQKSDGTLANPLTFPTFDGDAGLGPRGITVADIDKDGVPDIVTANTSSSISILPGLGAGVAFGAATVVPVSADGDVATTQPDRVAAEDLDGDNVLDLIVGCRGTNDVRVLRGLGDGDLAAPRPFAILRATTQISPDEVHVADVDGDGALDVVVAGSNDAVILEGGGDGLLFPGAQSGGDGLVADIGDLDGDGRADLLGPRMSSTVIHRNIQLNNGRLSNQAFSAGGSVTSVALGDFDGDDAPDAVGINTSLLRVFANDGGGGLLPADPPTISLAANGRGLATGDVTGDGDIDIVLSMPTRNEVAVLVGDGALGFTNPSPLSTQVATAGQSPVFVTLADIDGEDGPDIITANQSSNDLSVLRSSGSGTFASAKIVPAVFGAAAATVNMVRAGDVNGDGLLDLVTANLARNTVSVVIGFGNGSFAAPQTYAVPDGPTAVGVGDMNGDGLDDIVVASSSTGAITVLLSEGHP